MKSRRFLSFTAKLALSCALIVAVFGISFIPILLYGYPELVGVVSERLATIAGLVAAASALMGVATYLLFNRYIRRPMRILGRAAEHVIAGDINFRARIDEPKDFAYLAGVFNGAIESVVRTQVRADIDELTGLFNYRHARNYLQTQVGLAQRYNRHLSIALIDIDHFQEINDFYGHQAGNDVLRVAAGYFKSRLRQVDYVARYGGEEFLIVLPETSAPSAMMVIERIHAAFSEHVYVMQGESKNPVFMSAGVADFPLSGEDETNLTAAANMAVLLAKRRGRNQVAYFRGLDQKAG